jgi:hypothetical protein
MGKNSRAAANFAGHEEIPTILPKLNSQFEAGLVGSAQVNSQVIRRWLLAGGSTEATHGQARGHRVAHRFYPQHQSSPEKTQAQWPPRVIDRQWQGGSSRAKRSGV